MRELPDSYLAFQPIKSRPLAEDEWRCAHCAGIVGEDDLTCAHCGKYPSWGTPPQTTLTPLMENVMKKVIHEGLSDAFEAQEMDR